ncbi:hypothetical protein G5714_000318 [Onychostoma macrolepis]|uniref:Uncharacterized protein n=1 Tax=Onychostoma macrolepis TaxID=369639 RepID=A0A7J6DG82_9TELE|nr:hypothetical protein G5714_000318 [Onychostoma macrolepis]
MYALVKWCAGVDEGKFSIVHIKCIRNFDLESFVNGVIVGCGKRPKGGFPIYMATVQSVGEEKQKHGKMGGSKISQFLKGAADGEVRNTSEQTQSGPPVGQHLPGTMNNMVFWIPS